MDVLPLQFCTLRYFGLWREPSEQQHWLVKYIWKPLVINLLVFNTITLLGAMIVYRDNVSEFTECLFMSFTWLPFCLKLFNLLWRRSSMDDLLNEFRQDIFIARTDDERQILSTHRNILRIIFTLFVSVTQTCSLAFELTPLISLALGSESFELPYKTYELYDRQNLVYYSVAYVYQVLIFVVGASVNVCLDTLLSGFILLICAQIDISRRRFVASTLDGNYAQATRDCAMHQQSVRRVVRKMQSFFMCVVVPQLFFSLITLCTSLYNMTRLTIIDSFVFLMYLGCLQCQIFFYCWFGNELKLKTGTICETIYHSDWTAFSPSDRRHLYFILLVCQKDMSISFHGFCPITLEIYIWVLKTSYAAYNLLNTVDAKNG